VRARSARSEFARLGHLDPLSESMVSSYSTKRITVMDPDTFSQRPLLSQRADEPSPFYSGGMQCPKCGAANPGGVQFCTQCHFVLLHRCPNCWHEQAQGSVCEKCGLNFDAYWNLYLLKQADERAREDVRKVKAWAAVFFQILLLPYVSLRSLLRFLILRLASLRLFGH
jgi:hypothetical protein